MPQVEECPMIIFRRGVLWLSCMYKQIMVYTKLTLFQIARPLYCLPPVMLIFRRIGSCDMQLPRIGFGFILDRHHKFISIRNLTYVLLSLCIYLYACIHLHIYIYIYYTHTYIHIYIHTYIHIYIYTHIHIYIYTCIRTFASDEPQLRNLTL